jgi:hypothetical protein
MTNFDWATVEVRPNNANVKEQEESQAFCRHKDGEDGLIAVSDVSKAATSHAQDKRHVYHGLERIHVSQTTHWHQVFILARYSASS